MGASMKSLSYIWAEDLDGWIGKGGTLPWHLPADLKHFKSVTMNHPIIMGARTFDSIGRPLPKRDNIVVTHRDMTVPGVLTVHGVPELKRLLESQFADQQCFVIGGARLYQSLLPMAGELYRTVVLGHYHGDTKMPSLNYQQWHLLESEEVKSNQPTIPDCRFEHWQKL